MHSLSAHNFADPHLCKQDFKRPDRIQVIAPGSCCTESTVTPLPFQSHLITHFEHPNVDGKVRMSDNNQDLSGGHSHSPESGNSNSREVLLALARTGGLLAVLAIVGFLLLKFL